MLTGGRGRGFDYLVSLIAVGLFVSMPFVGSTLQRLLPSDWIWSQLAWLIALLPIVCGLWLLRQWYGPWSRRTTKPPHN